MSTWRDVASCPTTTQSHLRGIESRRQRRQPWSFGTQSHLRGIESNTLVGTPGRHSPWTQSHLRGIERRATAAQRSRRSPVDSIAPQRHRKRLRESRPPRCMLDSIAPQRHRKCVMLRALARLHPDSIAPQRHRKPFPAALARSHGRRLNRTSEASKDGLARPSGRRVRDSIAPQRHRKSGGCAMVSAERRRLNRTSEASKVCRCRRGVWRVSRLNRTSEASKAARRPGAGPVIRTQSHLRGIESSRRRRAKAELPRGLNRTSEASKEAVAVLAKPRPRDSIAPQRHRKSSASPPLRLARRTQSHLRGIERMRPSSASRCA